MDVGAPAVMVIGAVAQLELSDITSLSATSSLMMS
jgi:hypothetical protein